MRTLRSLITLAGERWSVKACWSSEEPERLQAYPEQRGRTHVEAGRPMGVVDVTASISSYKTPRGSDGHRGGKTRRGERECDPSRGSRFAAKTPGPGSLRREVTDTPRYVNIAGHVRWSGPCTLGNPPSRMDTWGNTREIGRPPPPHPFNTPPCSSGSWNNTGPCSHRKTSWLPRLFVCVWMDNDSVNTMTRLWEKVWSDDFWWHFRDLTSRPGFLGVVRQTHC